MKQLRRLDPYLRELFRITRTKNIPSNGPHRISVAGRRSKLSGGMGKDSVEQKSKATSKIESWADLGVDLPPLSMALFFLTNLN